MVNYSHGSFCELKYAQRRVRLKISLNFNRFKQNLYQPQGRHKLYNFQILKCTVERIDKSQVNSLTFEAESLQVRPYRIRKYNPFSDHNHLWKNLKQHYYESDLFKPRTDLLLVGQSHTPAVYKGLPGRTVCTAEDFWQLPCNRCDLSLPGLRRFVLDHEYLDGRFISREGKKTSSQHLDSEN
jgi:hypothetical protein